MLKITRLQGSSNWDLWAIRMEAVLTEKGYYEVMTSPTTTPATTEQESMLKKALAYIRLALSDGPLLQTRNIDDPRTLWTTLGSLYKPKGFSSEFLICKQFFETTLAKCNYSIEEYLHTIKRLTDDLAARSLTLPNKVIAAWTLNNLTDEYELTVAIISQLFRSSDGEISLDDLFSQLIDESRRLKSKNQDSEMALVSHPKPKQGGANAKKDKQEKQKCKHCKKSGHPDTKCWKKFPHLRPEKTKSDDNTTKEESDSNEVSLISNENLLFSAAKDSQNQWILDSGATSHILCDRTLFSTLESCDTTLNWGRANQIQSF